MKQVIEFGCSTAGSRGGDPAETEAVTFSGVQKQTDYAGEYQYENDVLQMINHEEGRIMIAGVKTVFTDDATASTNFTASNATLTTVTQNGSTYVKATSNGTVTRTGMFPIGGSFPVLAGERYRIRARGYRDKGTAATLGPFLDLSLNPSQEQIRQAVLTHTNPLTTTITNFNAITPNLVNSMADPGMVPIYPAKDGQGILIPLNVWNSN